MTLVVSGGTVVTPTGSIPDGYVNVCGDRIQSVGHGDPPERGARTIDASGAVVLPGLIDLHGDDIEDHVIPRSGVRVDPGLAAVAADRVNICHGITTKYHAIAFEETPEDNRTIELASEVAAAVDESRSLVGDNRIHARCEVATDRIDQVCSILETLPVGLVSIMHHEPGDGQYRRERDFRARYGGDGGTTEQALKRFVEARSRLDPQTYDRRIATFGALARARNVPLASHDDGTVERITQMVDHGVTIAEFPLTIEAARQASERGMTVAMGAPNLVDGGSHWGNLDATEAIDEDILDVLCSDYSPASLLSSMFVQTGEPLHRRVARVTVNPAQAVGLEDRGRLSQGSRADIIVVDPDPVPTVRNVIVAGRERINMPGEMPEEAVAIESTADD